LQEESVKYPGSCYYSQHLTKAGKLGSVCERMTIRKVISDDFGKTAVCSFYEAEDDFFAVSFALALPSGTSICMHLN
jgi:hypothetical protein